ncbi:TerC family protein [Acinetobacter puyangensis]|uniref:Membrane protein TerC, possibly involved in tellurium resistance n=1 Tax=Acinetobacter puyangensis TaxID=1096779 RepID=A0A240E459_9GAMM|nr:TerC family protein [Acinetobacter puyangensis]SNX43043.1 Membrane protein TerC, possibly involved in tellurium resistance [Acinetobacter puyangensis]
MMFEWMSDPSAWVGLLTLVVLEIVLGIDNLVFIAILAEKLPPEQRNKARIIGLSLALVMRLILLASISWVMTLKENLFEIFDYGFSGRDLILIFGGVFLLFKATMEIHERIEGKADLKEERVEHAAFWAVIAQIVVLDAIFSLDSVITAVGMVPHLEVMMIAVIIAVGVMLLASRPLMAFVNKHPTVVILCLAFLFMIGLSLVLEGFGIHIPKGYIYAAIGFSVLIEAINQATRRSREKMITTTDLRSRTASAVIRLLGGRTIDKNEQDQLSETADILATQSSANEVFSDEEKGMIHGVLTLAERPVKSIMTPRPDLEWLDLTESGNIKEKLLAISHSRVLIARGSLDNLEGVALTHKVLNHYLETGEIDIENSLRQPLVVHENIKVLTLMEQLRHAPMQIAIVLNEYGSIEGIATPIDILEAIAGEFPDDEDIETPEVEMLKDGSWMLEGSSDIRHVSLLVGKDLVNDNEEYSTLSGYLLWHLGRVPHDGEQVEADGFTFDILTMDGHKIDKVRITTLLPNKNDD